MKWIFILAAQYNEVKNSDDAVFKNLISDLMELGKMGNYYLV